MKTYPVFFSAFNARHLDSERIASNFVPNSSFQQLASLQHALIVGPRGSGKTHLLKMLQPKALACWTHSNAKRIRDSIGFIGVFIPADETWKQQIKCIADKIEPPLAERFTNSIFVTHFQRSLLDTFLQLTHDRPQKDNGFIKIDLSRQKEAELCQTLAKSWNLNPQIYSLLSIKQSLIDRMAQLHEYANHSQIKLKSLLDDSQSVLSPCATQGIQAFNAVSGQFQARWGLLFDELEIAPVSIQRELFSCLRSTDQNLIFKLAISPSASAVDIFNKVLGPSAGNDFEEISLYSDPKDSQKFCRELWKFLAHETNPNDTTRDPINALGNSKFHIKDPLQRNYRRTGALQKAFKELAEKDPSFCETLATKGVNPLELDKVTQNKKDSVVRKAAPLVGFRSTIIERGPSKKGEKSVLIKGKNSKAIVYSGWEALCLISEANPRWFTGIAKQLLLEQSRIEEWKNISISKQFDIILGASQKFEDYITTIPSNVTAPDNSKTGGLRYLVDELADKFRSSVLTSYFTLDPVMSFEVPDECNEAMSNAIADGLYSGAFIPLDQTNKPSVFSDIPGTRLRLTHLLAPLKTLPLRSKSMCRKLNSLVRNAPCVSPEELKTDSTGENNLKQMALFNE
ncbi:hypothetical protein OAR16_00320 [bacterium]|nr:hypothetical protein [bacterium]